MFRDSSAKDPRRTSTVPPVQRRTITEEVLDRLRDLLLRGVLKPGTRIDQAELASNFGVSTVPVREALLRLQSAGLVELVPHRGVFVAELSVEELLDIYTTREVLEEQAARVAAQHLTPTDLETLDRLAQGMQDAAIKQELDELLALNRQFHFTIYRAAKRRHLLQLIEQLWDLSTGYAHLQLHAVPDRASEALYEIRSIVAACKRKDADALALMMRYKVHQTTAGLLQHMSLPDGGSNGTTASEDARSSNARVGARQTAARKRPVKARSPKTSVKKKASAKKPTSTKSKKAKAPKATARGSGKKRTKVSRGT